MTLLETLEDCAKSVCASFYYATDPRANVIMDALQAMDYPVIIVIPYSVTDTINTNTGAIESEFDLDFWVLDKDNAETIDYTNSEVESKYAAPMRSLGRRFLHKINESEIVAFTDKNIEQGSFNTASQVFDAHLFGVKGRVESIPFIEQLTGCV